MDMKNRKTIIIAIVVITLIAVGVIISSMGENEAGVDTVKFKGKKYTLLEYNMDIFFYTHNKDLPYYEEDTVLPIKDSKYDTVFVNGDLFCNSQEISSANEYYGSDDNYDWFVVVEVYDVDKVQKVDLSEDEMEYLYSMEDLKKDMSLYVEDIESFGRIEKISKDGTVRAQINLALYEGVWYWRSEIIDETKEKDGTWPEYVQPLPENLCNKLLTLQNNN